MCHITVMKLIHAILGAGAASLLPSALADEPASKEARNYAITIASEVKPLAEPDLRYPAWAGARDIQGSCDVTFTISTAGKPDAVRVGACTAEVLRRSAKATTEKMRFAPRATASEGASMRITWTLENPALQTASLN